MDVAEFANRISFRAFKPELESLERWRWKGLSHWLGLADLSLEVANTKLPTHGRELRRRIRPLLTIPRMSTYAVGAIVNVGVAEMPPGSSFVNVGVWNGFTLLAGMAENGDRRSVGVDNFSEYGGPREAFLARFESRRGKNDAFVDADYVEYFRSLHDGSPIGFYIYDGGHEYEDQVRGLELAEPFFVPGSVVLVDDTNWDEVRAATLAFVGSRRGRFEIVCDRTTAANGHPTLWNGIMLLRRTAVGFDG